MSTTSVPASESVARRERPILFSGAMVRAILEGRKTQTRRVAEFVPLQPGLNLAWSGLSVGDYCTGNPESGTVLYARRGDGCWEQKTRRLFCPYGRPGDRLWVRESIDVIDRGMEDGGAIPTVVYLADGTEKHIADLVAPDSLNETLDSLRRPARRPGIHMHRWASRITLEIVSARVERLNAITTQDAYDEGVTDSWPHDDLPYLSGFGSRAVIVNFFHLWDSINGKRSGCAVKANPWVWRIEFRRVEEAAS